MTTFSKKISARMVAGGRKGMRGLTSRMGREEIFFNFPSRMWKGKRFFSISLPAWRKGRDFFQFPFPHVGREEIVFPFPFSTITLISAKVILTIEVINVTKTVVFIVIFFHNLIIFKQSFIARFQTEYFYNRKLLTIFRCCLQRN